MLLFNHRSPAVSHVASGFLVHQGLSNRISQLRCISRRHDSPCLPVPDNFGNAPCITPYYRRPTSHRLQTDLDYIEKIAREQLGMVKKDEYLYHVRPSQGKKER